METKLHFGNYLKKDFIIKLHCQMKKILFSVIPFLLIACQYLDKKAPTEQELLDKRMKEIDWKKVDKLPSIVACETVTESNQQKACFFEFLTQNIQDKIGTDSLSVIYATADTLKIKVTVFATSKLKFESQFSKDTTQVMRQKTDSVLAIKLTDFPKISPAIKRGIPVNTQFVLPIVLPQTTDKNLK
ncbi:hypothetical protein FB1_04560 [Flavobacterium branchiophilum NBRC 15030 = ATCC 35035]|uniref:Uncharacterized protein n=2 Tax=Flavobacterium branchiophilum TaxID=55197 RepID=A0A543G3L9_9FLAO|nr:hypothetical protein BC670_1589 [Flavobacterium branchiophilum]GEM54235.1 hypothetical protein FB1_04560 [Flavobacterium branchiophilum NBRC 15030 = ATCC 35035]